ncbi:hypothetical protein ACLKA6_013159 [Drosophila palustris]
MLRQLPLSAFIHGYQPNRQQPNQVGPSTGKRRKIATRDGAGAGAAFCGLRVREKSLTATGSANRDKHNGSLSSFTSSVAWLPIAGRQRIQLVFRFRVVLLVAFSCTELSRAASSVQSLASRSCLCLFYACACACASVTL